jgi:hypothetical protein
MGLPYHQAGIRVLERPAVGYADASFSSADDWEKYAYTFRLFGRLTYNPTRRSR